MLILCPVILCPLSVQCRIMVSPACLLTPLRLASRDQGSKHTHREVTRGVRRGEASSLLATVRRRKARVAECCGQRRHGYGAILSERPDCSSAGGATNIVIATGCVRIVQLVTRGRGFGTPAATSWLRVRNLPRASNRKGRGCLMSSQSGFSPRITRVVRLVGRGSLDARVISFPLGGI